MPHYTNVFSAALFKSGNRWRPVGVASRLELTVFPVSAGVYQHSPVAKEILFSHTRSEMPAQVCAVIQHFISIFYFACFEYRRRLKCESCCITCRSLEQSAVSDWRLGARWVLEEKENKGWRFILLSYLIIILLFFPPKKVFYCLTLYVWLWLLSKKAKINIRTYST